MIDGQDVTELRTRKTMYDNDCIVAIVDRKRCMLPVYVVEQMINEFSFETETKRKYTYLTKAVLKK